MSVAAGYAAEIRETVETLNRLVRCLNAEGGEVELDVSTYEITDGETDDLIIAQNVTVDMKKVTRL